MAETLIGGFISVSSVIDTGSRDVFKIILDKDRQSKICSASHHIAEKAQYKYLSKFIKSSGCECDIVSSGEFAELTGGEAFGGIAAIVGDRKTLALNQIAQNGNFTLILDGIEDPFNFGYVLRTAYACGCDGVFLPERNYFTSSDIVIRSSAGASERLPIAFYKTPDEICNVLQSNKIKIVCTSKTENSVKLSEVEFVSPLCVVIGGEKRGINKELLSKADYVVSIDYKNSFSLSLSASSAAAIIIYGIASGIK